MTLVTTSRRSTQLLRSIAKDLAFATGSRYLPRGKHGLREISDDHDLFMVIDTQGRDTVLTVFLGGTPALKRIISSHEQGIRDWDIHRGVTTSDQGVRKLLERICPVAWTNEGGFFIAFDGPQKRFMKLHLREVVISEA